MWAEMGYTGWLDPFPCFWDDSSTWNIKFSHNLGPANAPKLVIFTKKFDGLGVPNSKKHKAMLWGCVPASHNETSLERSSENPGPEQPTLTMGFGCVFRRFSRWKLQFLRVSCAFFQRHVARLSACSPCAVPARYPTVRGPEDLWPCDGWHEKNTPSPVRRF